MPASAADVNDRLGDFEGKIAVVTGGTQGLGETVARLFAARGAEGLVIVGRNGERGRAVAYELTVGGCRTEFVAADLAVMSDVAAIVPAAERAFGRVDVLVNAAAITDRGTIFDTSPALFDRMFAVNVRAPFFLMQDAAKLMRARGIEGTMVNVLSMSAHGGQPFIAAYCGSKGALATLTRNAAFSLMPWRIRVNGLNPGWMATPGEDRTMRTYHGAEDGWLEKAAAEQPFGRLIDPQEAARAIAFLASAESGLMTGAIVDFDQSVLGCYETAPHPSKPE
ncbi:SDR family oxidoreductase [Chelatococcus sp. SYSU_G07232]|uniref:SDR family oxidoreductase n=1 Tax=Chelatococcus albus TaxID=3047466 RepID=A0ABT7AI44_9HYPH|nr:SDR family oxidoreductase [Chelatococcus sp. SYSU_G07232]MDJ1159066.1 SDR family oxidoreductase [Chelatococcus sp. SYSU_G07232]